MNEEEKNQLNALYSKQELQQCMAHPNFEQVLKTGSLEEAKELARRILVGMAKSTQEKREKNLRYKVFKKSE